MFQHATPDSSAYPPTRSQLYFPLSINHEWTLPQFDELVADAMASSVIQLDHVAVASGQKHTDSTPVYGNYALPQSYTSERIFGAQLARLRVIKEQYDPGNVMGLSGEWKV